MTRHPVLRPGDTLRLGGATHTVAGLDGATVRLADVTGVVTEVPIAVLLADPGLELVTPSRVPLVPAQPWPGQVNLRGLRPLARAEIQWGLFMHTQRARPTRRDLGWIRSLVASCRAQEAGSLIDLELSGDGVAQQTRAIVKEMLHELRLVYFTPAQAKQAGFLETGHFGVLFPHRMSHIDLTGIPQRWLRDLTWDYIADLLRSPGCPRTASPVDGFRRAAAELGVFLELEAPGGGHEPAALRREHMDRFVADQRHRERQALPSLAVKRPGGGPSTVTITTRSMVFNAARKLLRDALERGAAERLGLDREFIIAVPAAGATLGRTARRPFPDEVARALADEANLAALAATYDVNDGGVRDIWETTVITGRRIGEVIKLRWDCIGRYGGLAMFWHDQTKVGNYDAAIRIPERLYDLLAERQRKTLDRFTARYGYRPSGQQRARLALFPTIYRSQDGTVPLTHQWFYSRFRPWVDAMDLGHYVPHQARHTLATSLLRHGATLTHIRRYLGQVSDRMAEHYAHLSHSDLEDILQHVWVAGPGTASPGQLLAGDAAPLSREQARALAIDLSRRSTPAEGGFCTFQPVVDGGGCPGTWTATTAANSSCPGPTCSTGGASANNGGCWPKALPATPPPPTCTTISSPPPAPSTAWRKPWPDSASWTTPSPWTCASHRTTSTASGAPPSGPPTSPPQTTVLQRTTTISTAPAMTSAAWMQGAHA
jgi:integrase